MRTPFPRRFAPAMACLPRRCFAGTRRAGVLALVAVLNLSAISAQARGGGGGGHGGWGGGGGGYHFSGGGEAWRGDGDAWRGGYRGYHPMYGPGARPGWDSIDVNRNLNVENNFYNRPYNGWHSNWANGGYWNNRPWNHGWYGWQPSTWGWWGANAAAWGVAGLATGAAITSLVNTASQEQSPVIVVPQTSIQLNYASVDPVGTYGVSFTYSMDDGATLLGAANCQAGLLNGQIPDTVDQAQLLNTVCHVAYGSGS
ncbi:hypothetical protein [Synechococcus sp. CBW1006]|uniref:hypothetical protein n=1 Tax=Synechococcus sp. CBW1006 TaxID=1353138 RepID=UPI001E495A6F|nr:hypothetical protein [Synechococcus sp. CBW1006]